jgi:protein phosphatase
VAATIIGRHLYIANIGDSRLYVVGDDIRQMTRDHSLVAEMVRMGEVNDSEARVHPDKNIITRAIGASGEVEADFFEVDLNDGEQVLLCTDGLTNMVEDEVIKEIMQSDASPEERVEKLVQTANRNGGRDNITVMTIQPFS